MKKNALLAAVLLAVCLAFSSSALVSAFSPVPTTSGRPTAASALFGSTTVEPPTREKTDTDRKTQREKRSYTDDDIADIEDPNAPYSDLEYLIDAAESREMEDPFHILLMGTTFEKPRITVSYVTNALEYVLSMPTTEGQELSEFAKDEGMSCLGTWPREECLNLGKQLQLRDIVCRVVPFCEGGQRGWQAKDASDASSSSSNSNADSFS